jgi:hypothetical protein
MAEPSRQRIPVEIIFNPAWWNRHCGISFDQSFYFDKDRGIQDDLVMRRALYERFGIGDPDHAPRPIIGSPHVAGGFIVAALLGIEIRFFADQAPWPIPANLSRTEILGLRVPDLATTWPMNRLIAQMDELEKKFGYVVGDFNTEGVFDTALQLRGQELFVDLLEDAELIQHLFGVVAETQAQVAAYVRSRTGTNSVSTNRSILNVNPQIYLHSNCSVQMISPETYAQVLFPFECGLAARLRPYGIHHCGNNLERFAETYRRTRAVFYDVGWGSDVARCSMLLPEAFLNLRLSPVRMLQESAETIGSDTRKLLADAGRMRSVGVCCINMDYGTAEENVRAMFRAVEDFGS